MQTAPAVALLILLNGITAAPVNDDVLCVGTSAVTGRAGAPGCRPRADVIEPENAARAFIVLGSDGKTIRIGQLPAGATSLGGRDEQHRPTSLKFVLTAQERIRFDCLLSLSAPGRESADPLSWSIDLPSRTAMDERHLLLPAGKYAVAVDCKGFAPLRTVVETAGRPAKSVLELRLLPLPHISGRVVAAEPVIAVLHDTGQRFLGQTEPDGSFQVWLNPDDWPRSLAISAPGFGTVVAQLPSSAMAVELADVELVRAGHLAIAGPPEQLRDIEAVEIAQLTGKRDRRSYRHIDKEDFQKGNFIVRDIPPGRYSVVLAGDQPLERFAETVEVVAGETVTLLTEWTSEDVAVRTFVGEEVLGSAEVLLESVEGMWRTSLTTSAEGMRSSPLWQPGEVVFMLEHGDVAGYSGKLQLRGPSVDIRITSRTVQGTVVDADSGEPIAGVGLLLSSDLGGRIAKSREDGTFRFIGVKPGRYKLAAGGERGFSHESIAITVPEEVMTREVRLPLRSQAQLEVEVVTSRGTPAVRALLFELAANTVASIREADEGGKVYLPLGSAVPRSIVVLTSDGGLYARSLPQKSENRIRVNVPPPTSTLRITLESEDHEPIGGIALAMRFNGVMFPPPVMHLLGERAGIMLRSDVKGQIRVARVPAGLYEFWPVRSRSDVDAILGGYPGTPPLVIAAGPGENTARLGFERVTSKPKVP